MLDDDECWVMIDIDIDDTGEEEDNDGFRLLDAIWWMYDGQLVHPSFSS